jgi:branched-chain amino acid transport system ATP-binding protein
MNMLKITNLDAFYGESHVLHGIDLAVEAGEVVTLIGRNGAGKTTTLKSIIGDIPRRTGSILFNGTEIINTPSERICKMSVGFVPDDRGIFSTLSVYENLTIGRPVGQYAWPLDRIYDLFPALRERRVQKASSLSGGEQQMLAIARPLYMGASFLLLDEPTEGLAPVIIDAIGTIVRQIKAAGLTILLVEQNLPFATEVADRHYLLENGRVVREMTNQEVSEEEETLLAHLGV